MQVGKVQSHALANTEVVPSPSWNMPQNRADKNATILRLTERGYRLFLNS